MDSPQRGRPVVPVAFSPRDLRLLEAAVREARIETERQAGAAERIGAAALRGAFEAMSREYGRLEGEIGRASRAVR